MAQRDIQDIASYMKQLDESKAAEDKACEEACRECEEQQALEFEELGDDEVIDKASMGFIDDDDQQQDESDSFYDECDGALEEDISNCVEQEAADAPDTGSIEVEVYNEDGYGKFFTKELMKQVQGIVAAVKKALPNGDLLVKVTGPVDQLENAFAFYIGKPDYDVLPDEDKKEFQQLLVLDDGDTYAESLAEADYREAVAHCLDPIGVHASTASLADKDTCALSVIKEEKAKRSAKKMLKCLKENDFSSLSDDDLDKLDNIKDAIDSGEGIAGMTASEKAVWKAVLDDMGVTQAEWDKLTPEEQEKLFNQSEAGQPIPKSNFGDGVHTGTDMKTGKKVRWRIGYNVKDPSTGEYTHTAWNPNYHQEDSILQHPADLKRQEKAYAKSQEQAEKDKKAKEAMRRARGKEWTNADFMAMIQNLSDAQKKQMMNAMIDEIKAEVPDAKQAGKEIQVIKNMFGKKQTLRDYAAAWGTSFPAVKLFADRVEGALYQAAQKATGKASRAEALKYIINSHDTATKQKFADAFEEVMNAVKGRGDQTIDPERAARKAKAKASATAK